MIGSLARRKISARSLLLLLTLAWAASSALSCAAPEAEVQAPGGVLLITVGNLRSDAVDSADGGLAEALPGAVRYARAYAPSPLEVQSAASLLVGRLPTRAGAVGVLESQPPEAAPTLFSRLRRQGWSTAWIVQRAWGARAGFTRGADLVEAPSNEDWEPGEVTRRALRALEDLLPAASGAEAVPFLLAVHYAVGPGPRQAFAEDAPKTRDEYRALADGVVQEIASLVGSIPETSDVTVVVAGANGYELGEHGSLGAGFTVREEAIRVPLLVRHGAPPAERVEPVVSTLDVAATILHLAGAELEPQALDGDPLLDEGGALLAELPRRDPRLAEVVVREWAIVRGVIGDRYKYVHAVRDVPAADRPTVASGLAEIQAAMTSGAAPVPALFGDAAREELFDLVADPEERQDLLAERAGEIGPLRGALRNYRASCDETAFTPGAITQRLDVDPSKMRELESLGYL